MEDIKYGIWDGKFQIIQKGHEYVMIYVSEKYPHVCIGIINPSPEMGLCDDFQYNKMHKKYPFTYFQRAYLWNLLLRYHSIEAVVVPHWKPHISLKLESTFLPKTKREWILPSFPDMDDKKEDLEKLGEKVQIYSGEPPEYKDINTSAIRRMFYKGDSNFVADIPEKLQKQTQELLAENKINKQFIIVPLVGDKINSLLICGGIQLSIDMDRMLIFAPVVEVQNIEEWWKDRPIEKPRKDHFFTFYQKHEMINSIMKSLQYYEYMVIPIILKNETCEGINVFLPDASSRCWIIEKDINFHSAFCDFNEEEILHINRDKINVNILAKVFCLVSALYSERNYYFFSLRKDTEEKKERVQDIKDNENYNVDYYKDLKDIMEEVIDAQEVEKFLIGLKRIDGILKCNLMEQNRKEIDDAIKSKIESVNKKECFLETIMKNIFENESYAAGVIVGMVSNLELKV